ncbi:hypothetical protein SEMRO_2597_G332160.1 [Seminavis robusta]|uniref:Uncharacterized protein n=1 Tax=Seminavis robusta TaxID=568900 RepID=A0A9N8HXV7_9STRA|nr:hypothetical protein SEMRO_2597_G332160.1 [Seminavis robusta]|eukprot:Sro2597_g332160.1 n/a (188) ;mRNA; f:6192-6840
MAENRRLHNASQKAFNEYNFDNIDENFTADELALINGPPVTLSTEDRTIKDSYDGLKCPLFQEVPALDDMMMWGGVFMSKMEVSIFRNQTRQQREQNAAARILPLLHPSTRVLMTEEEFYEYGNELTLQQRMIVNRTIRFYKNNDFQGRLDIFHKYQRLRDHYQMLEALDNQRRANNAPPDDPAPAP